MLNYYPNLINAAQIRSASVEKAETKKYLIFFA